LAKLLLEATRMAKGRALNMSGNSLPSFSTGERSSVSDHQFRPRHLRLTAKNGGRQSAPIEIGF
jgi:hypothetical protein